MKWSILGLFSLGLVAAVCAAMLVTSIRAGEARAGAAGAVLRPLSAPASGAPGQESEAAVLVAARALEALSVLDASALRTERVPLDELEPGAVASVAAAIGRVLVRPVEEGEPITTAVFAGEGSGVHVASALRPGMRAVSVALNDNMGLETLLYPGSVVDVLASMALRDAGADERPVAMTLLQGVFVLAVGEETVVSEGPREGEAAGATARASRRPNVTLLVDSKQAEALKLAMQEGSVSLVLRNPADESLLDDAGTPLHELSPILETPRATREVVVMKGGQTQTKTFQARPAGPPRP